MMADLFQFEWKVDQNGYASERRRGRDPDGYGDGEFEYIEARGGPLRFYRPLDESGLWLRFADTCRSREGVLQFVRDYGTLYDGRDIVERYRRLAERLWAIYERLSAGDRGSAAALFTDRTTFFWRPPNMRLTILQHADRPETFELTVIPNVLEDALKHQAAQAITGNRQFRRCRNQGCANWFRLGPRAASEGGRTFTARREFCSDRCRVGHARRQRREAAAHA
jgi:hypothetical protein